MKRPITLAIALFLAVAMVSVTADARRGHRKPRGTATGMCELTDEQRTAIHDKVVEMREADATREEIRTAVAEMFSEFGVEVPDKRFGRKGNGGHFCADLTDEQRTAIHDKVVEMREADATREEIRAAVAEMLEEFGVELPEDWTDRGNRRGHGRGRNGECDASSRMQMFADMAVIDAEIQAAPAAPSAKPKLMSGTWASLKR